MIRVRPRPRAPMLAGLLILHLAGQPAVAVAQTDEPASLDVVEAPAEPQAGQVPAETAPVPFTALAQAQTDALPRNDPSPTADESARTDTPAGSPAAEPSASAPARETTPFIPDAADPFESLNRQIYGFNAGLDEAIMQPVARTYERYVPKPLQTGLSNMVSNLLDPYIAANNLLQGKPKEALSDLARFVVNTTVGVVGIGDPASEMGLEKHREDFGQTLAVWGVPAGPYMMLPVFGPSTLRDTAGFVVDVFGALVARFKNVDLRNSIAALEFVQQRVRALPAQQFLDDALDPYLLVRSGYLQRRRSLIYDGNPPDE